MDILPERLKISVLPQDTIGAAPGSTHKCAIANTVRRVLGEAYGVPPSFVSIRYDGATVTWNGRVHHYKLPTAAGRIQMMNEFNELAVPEKGVPLTLKMEGMPKKAADPQAIRDRQPRVNTARAVRAAMGRPDKKYENPRKMVARAARQMAKDQAARG